jgi:hypothetical protein
MKINVGVIDRVIRIVIALIFIGLYFTQVVTGTPAIVLLVLAAVFILTSLIGFCPLYLPFNINTRGKHKNKF